MAPMSAFDALPLRLPQLVEVREAFTQAIAEGLSRDGQLIAAFPAYLAPPSAGLHGRARVVDWGGTNLRGARVDLTEKGPRVSALAP